MPRQKSAFVRPPSFTPTARSLPIPALMYDIVTGKGCGGRLGSSSRSGEFSRMNAAVVYRRSAMTWTVSSLAVRAEG